MKKNKLNLMVLSVLLLSLLSIVEVFSANVSAEKLEKTRPVITSYYPSSEITHTKCEVKSYKTEFNQDFVDKWSTRDTQSSTLFAMVGDDVLSAGVQYCVKVLLSPEINGMSVTADSISDEQLYLSLKAVLPQVVESNSVSTKTTTVLTSASSYSGGSGTSADPYLIANQEDLLSLSNYSPHWDKCFKQTADIHFSADSSAVDWDQDGEYGNSFYTPIGSDSNPFTGEYDGQNFNIINLNITASNDNAGMFGYCDDASIHDVILVNLRVASTAGSVGGLVGHVCNSTISDCYVSGIVSGTGNVGGLIGQAVTDDSSINISTCMTNVHVEATASAAGFIGFTKLCNITESSSYGTVNSSYEPGAFIGQSILTTVSGSFSSSNCNTTSVNGLIQQNFYANTITNSYYYDDPTFSSSTWISANLAWTYNSAFNGGFPYLQSKADMFETVITDFKYSGDWSNASNWTNGVPSTTLPTYVAIWDTCSAVGQAIDVDVLKFGSEGHLKLGNTGTLNVPGNLLLPSDKRGTAELGLVDENQVSLGGGNIIQEKYIKAGEWVYICAPMSTTLSNLFSHMILADYVGNEGGDYWVSRYDEVQKSDSAYLGGRASGMKWVTDDNTTFAAGEGFMVWLNNDKTISYTYSSSSLKTVDDIAASYTANAIDPLYSGWNLVGNPFTFSITYDGIFSIVDNTTNFESTLYVWDGISSSYKVALADGTGDAEAKTIAPLQAFFVKKKVDNPASLTLDNVEPKSAVVLRSATDYTSDVLTVKLESDGVVNNFYLRIHDGMTDGFDSNFDAYKFSTSSTSSPLVYGSDSEGHALAINSIPVQGEKEVPLVVKTLNQASGFNISFGIVGDIQYSLVDKQEGQTYDISDSTVLSFVGESTSMTDRFIILVKNDGVATSCDDISDIPALDIDVAVSSNLLTLISEEENDVQVNVVDMSGRLVYDNSIQSGVRSEIGVVSGVYILKLSQGGMSNRLKVVVR